MQRKVLVAGAQGVIGRAATLPWISSRTPAVGVLA